ncbi:hypothetical protein EKO27_g2110 [Xylaria grammica]|uniref:Uncharacterized protein n=1 Tax=Xylaria grammica TaxID=363999 RepID=A0A439DF51_9PEZI|nr:hypothetical protein EKO27_g2110 [Xylaria grammica]
MKRAATSDSDSKPRRVGYNARTPPVGYPYPTDNGVSRDTAGPTCDLEQVAIISPIPLRARKRYEGGYLESASASEPTVNDISGYEAEDEGDTEEIRQQKASRARRKKRTLTRYWPWDPDYHPKSSWNIKSDEDDGDDDDEEKLGSQPSDSQCSWRRAQSVPRNFFMDL